MKSALELLAETYTLLHENDERLEKLILEAKDVLGKLEGIRKSEAAKMIEIEECFAKEGETHERSA